MSTSPGSVCQHCNREVVWSHRPKDAGYAAFVHVDTGTISCDKPASDD